MEKFQWSAPKLRESYKPVWVVLAIITIFALYYYCEESIQNYVYGDWKPYELTNYTIYYPKSYIIFEKNKWAGPVWQGASATSFRSKKTFAKSFAKIDVGQLDSAGSKSFFDSFVEKTESELKRYGEIIGSRRIKKGESEYHEIVINYIDRTRVHKLMMKNEKYIFLPWKRENPKLMNTKKYLKK